MLNFVGKHFGIISIIGVFTGLFFGDYLTFTKHYTVFGLGLLMFLAFLKTDLTQIFNKLKRPFVVFGLVILKLIIAPILVYFIAHALNLDQTIALVLLAAAPAAMATPSLLDLLNGDINVGLLVCILTNLLTPFILPFVFLYTIKTEISFDVSSMFIFLLSIVLIPFFISILFEKISPNLTKKINNYSSAIMSLNMLIFNISVVAPYSKMIFENIQGSIWIFVIVLIFSAFLHLIAIVFSFKDGKKMIITSIIIIAYFNTGLAIVLANQYFDPQTVLATVLYEFIWASGFVPLKMIFCKREKGCI